MGKYKTEFKITCIARFMGYTLEINENGEERENVLLSDVRDKGGHFFKSRYRFSRIGCFKKANLSKNDQIEFQCTEEYYHKVNGIPKACKLKSPHRVKKYISE